MYSNFKQHLESVVKDIKDAGHYRSERVIDGPQDALISVGGRDVCNVSKSNTGKTAAWTSASHIEKDPKKKEPTP